MDSFNVIYNTQTYTLYTYLLPHEIPHVPQRGVGVPDIAHVGSSTMMLHYVSGIVPVSLIRIGHSDHNSKQQCRHSHGILVLGSSPFQSDLTMAFRSEMLCCSLLRALPSLPLLAAFPFFVIVDSNPTTSCNLSNFTLVWTNRSVAASSAIQQDLNEHKKKI